MAAPKKKSKRKAPSRNALSADDLAAAKTYAQILRWAAMTLERLDSKAYDLHNVHAAMTYLQKQGSTAPLAEYAKKHGIPVPTGPSGVLGRGLFEPEPPYEYVVSHVAAELRKARSARDEFAQWLLDCQQKTRDVVTVFGRLYGLKREAVLALSTRQIAMQGEMDVRLPPKTDADWIADRNRWVSWAVGSVKDVLTGQPNEERLNSASTGIFYARRAAKMAMADRSVAGIRAREALDLDEQLPILRKEILELAEHPRVRAARAGTSMRSKRGGKKNAAIQLVALATNLSERVVEEAVAAGGKSGLLTIGW